VEVDVLTGATTILRSDLVYDCGQSLNPAVDLGQVSSETTGCSIDIIVWMICDYSEFCSWVLLRLKVHSCKG
jgi:xanthine dehydrogenase molybdopterin-binding subunit B